MSQHARLKVDVGNSAGAAHRTLLSLVSYRPLADLDADPLLPTLNLLVLRIVEVVILFENAK